MNVGFPRNMSECRFWGVIMEIVEMKILSQIGFRAV